MRSADAACNPYIVFKLLLAAGFEGIENHSVLGKDTFTCSSTGNFAELPNNLEEALKLAKSSGFVKENLSPEIYEAVFKRLEYDLTEYNLSDNKPAFENENYFKII